MAKINSIRSKYFNEGKRIVEIARETKTDVKTVKKYILKDDFNTQPPQTKKTAKSKLDPFKEEIDCWLEQDKLERRKQRHTALRVFKRLQEKHGGSFDCSYRLVATYVAQKRKELYNVLFGTDSVIYISVMLILGSLGAVHSRTTIKRLLNYSRASKNSCYVYVLVIDCDRILLRWCL